MKNRRSLQGSPVRLARDVMRRDPLSIHAATTLDNAARFLTSRNIGAAPVINDAGRPLGVISRSDIVRKAGTREDEQSNLSNLTAYDVMTPSLLLVKQDTPIAKIVELLLDHNVRRVFVADDDGVLIGVVSTSDIMTSLREPAEQVCAACAGAT